MARTVTLLQLRNDARLWADNRTSSPASAHITDAELTRLINLQLSEFYEMFVAARGADPGTINTVNVTTTGTTAEPVAADVFQVVNVSIHWGGTEWEQLHSLPTGADRTMARRLTWDRYCDKYFRARGAGGIEFLPTPPVGTVVRVDYIPAFVDLVDDADSYDGVNGWEKVVTMGAALEMLAIAQAPTGDLPRLWAEQKARILGMVDDMQALDPGQIRDVEGGNHGRWNWWSR